ncbi:Metallo-dependent hydrolase [Ramaria rubella]|nr:Metallo-dependent hydrolase [Ramaria rubella]
MSSPHSLILQGGYVLHFDPASSPTNPRITFKIQDILIQGTNIVKIEESIPVPANATVINAGNHIVSPGFVDTHRHLWQAVLRGIVHPRAIADQSLIEYACSVKTVCQPLLTSEDMYWSQLAGACEAISAGITTILDHAHCTTSRAHIDRMLDASCDSGLRSVFAYSKVNPESWKEWQLAHIRAVGRRLQASPDQRVTLGLGYDGFVRESPADVAATLAAAKSSGSSLTTAHIVPSHFSHKRHLTDIHAATNALSSSFVLSHFNHAASEDIELVKTLNIGIACTPETELAMGHGQCTVFDCAARGIKAGLGVDTHIMCSGDMFGQMRLALQSARSIRNAALYLGGGSDKPPHRVPRSLVHTAAHMVRFATLGGAETLNMAETIGSLEVGKLADIVLISLSSPNMLGVTPDSEALIASMVVLAHPSDVKTVIINGEIVKLDGELRRTRWNDVASNFRAQQKDIDIKIKQTSNATDWEKTFDSVREGWGLMHEQVTE